MTVIISIVLLRGVLLMQLAIRYDENIHRKLKIIAAYKNKSLNGLMLDLFDKTIKDWEAENGEIKLPD